MITPPEDPGPITYGCLHCVRAAASVRARSLGFWNDARPQRPTISSGRMVAGTSGATPGSGAVEGDDENDGRLMLPHAPRNIVSAEAIPRLPTARALRDQTMVFPRAYSWPHPPRSQAQNCCRSNDVQQITLALRFGFLKHPIL